MKLEIKLVRSLIGRKPNQVKTAHALGLKKINQDGANVNKKSNLLRVLDELKWVNLKTMTWSWIM